jgi:ABC-type multidrug transport system fused ATPase/permease subunit
MAWVGYSKLQIPMRAQLSAVIFEKSLRRKNVKSVSKSDKAKSNDTGDGGNSQTADANSTEDDTKPTKDEAQQDAEGEDEEGAGQKSRQAVINLMSVDAKITAEFATYISQIFSSITGLITGVWFLVVLLGWMPILLGMLVWGITMPINGYFAKFFSKNYGKLMIIRDQKLAIITESLQGIRQIKFSALEGKWEKRIFAARQRELAALWKLLVSQAVVITVWFMSPIALAAVSFSVYVWKNGELTPAVAFVAVAVFNVLEEKVSDLPMVMTEGVECWVSLKRIQEYLDGPELEKKTKEGPEVVFEQADIAWPVDQDTDERERFVLRGVSLTFPKGELSVISGKTGSGKSLLLAAILGEADILAGSIYTPKAPLLKERFDNKANPQNWILPSSFAFVGQIPWLENATLRDNILFGLPYDSARYNETIEACALTKDIEMLPDEDKTELGPNGINISGGQKWRVTLARAVYSRAGILVLDDIFSAVDAHVGRHLLEKCLVANICKGRTRIVVTHHVGLIASQAKYVAELADGGIAAAGLTSELEEEGVLARIRSHEQPHRGTEEFDGPTRRNTAELPVLEGAEADMADEEDVDGNSLKLVRSKTGQKFVEDEKVEKGNVKWEVYESYIRESGGWFWWALAMVLFTTSQTLFIGKPCPYRVFLPQSLGKI